MKFSMRRRFILNKNLQYSILLISFFYVILIFLVAGAALFAPLMIEMDTAAYASQEVLEASHQLLYLHENFWPAGLLCLFLIGLHSIRTSHRIAGPVHRLRNVLENIKDGNLPGPLHRSRRGDYLEDEIELTNQMLENLRTKIGEIQKTYEQLSAAINTCDKLTIQTASDEIIHCMKDIKERENKLEETIRHFRIES